MLVKAINSFMAMVLGPGPLPDHHGEQPDHGAAGARGHAARHAGAAGED